MIMNKEKLLPVVIEPSQERCRSLIERSRTERYHSSEIPDKQRAERYEQAASSSILRWKDSTTLRNAATIVCQNSKLKTKHNVMDPWLFSAATAQQDKFYNWLRI